MARNVPLCGMKHADMSHHADWPFNILKLASRKCTATGEQKE